MPGLGHSGMDVAAASYLYGFVVSFSLQPSVLEELFTVLKLLDVQILVVGGRVGDAPRDATVMSEMRETGHARE